MARRVNEKEYDARRKAILDATLKLIYTLGYEKMTIQDLLDELIISKGAFYHYFDSKHALLEALITRMLDEVIQYLTPIVENPELNALEKFKRYFDSAARWKYARKEIMLAMLQGWYQDDNVLVREKLRIATINRLSPIMASIIRQGQEEGFFNTSDPQRMGEVALTIMSWLSDSMAAHFMKTDSSGEVLKVIESNLAAYSGAVERVLGAPAESLVLFETDTLKDWFQPAGEKA
jgi:TetR/AcrR family transcriptional regulator, transcriptional repressor for nem operon